MSNQTFSQNQEIHGKCVNTIRTLAMDAIQKANSGHPGAPMGLASAAYVLFYNGLKHNPKNPYWFNRDRFVLSGGHASMLLYSLLHLTGYDLTLEDLQNFLTRIQEWQVTFEQRFGTVDGISYTASELKRILSLEQVD